MTQSDYMKYKDVSYGGEKYRAVTFTSYRPYYTTYSSSTGNSYQDENGYNTNTVYWFKYEPIKWRVLDPATGLVLCDTIIDSQAYLNTIYENGTDPYNSRWSAYWKDSAYTTYANNYAESTIREWLNADFYNTAFSALQQQAILTSTLDNSAYSTYCSAFNSASTSDKVFLLSFSEVQNTAYGFTSGTGSTATRQASGCSDYAKSQGLWVDTTSGYSNWRLRSAGYRSYFACYVYYDGLVNDYYYVDFTNYGVRPALKLNLQSVIPQSCSHTYTETVTPPDCTHQGYTTHTCTRCGDSYKDNSTNALGHNTVKTAAVAATYEAVGNKEYYKCTVCSKIFSDAAGKNEISLASTVIPKLVRAAIEFTDSAVININSENCITAAPGADFAEIAKLTKANVELLNSSGTKAEGNTLKTGMKIVLRAGGKIVDTVDVVILGDVDGDGKVTSADARLTLRAAVGLDKQTEVQSIAANTDTEAKITSADARLILRAAVGLEDMSKILSQIKAAID